MSGEHSVQHCRKCGCHNEDACWGDETGACWWVEDDLCSACAGEQPDAKRDVEFLVFDCEDLLPSSTPVSTCDDFDGAVEIAARRKGYVVDEFGAVAWASPRLDVYRLMAAMVRSFQPELAWFLRHRCDDIKSHVRAHRMSEVA